MIRIREGGAASMLLAMLVAIGLAGVGCGSDPTSPKEPLTAEVMQALDRAIQDEFRAENIYLGVLADFGDVAPFRNIVYAEERHSQAIATLFVRRDLPVPLSVWDLNNVPRFASLAVACAARVQAEIENIELYDGLMALSPPVDVRTVFDKNRAASLDRHPPAFRGCS